MVWGLPGSLGLGRRLPALQNEPMGEKEPNRADWLPSDWVGLGLDYGTVGLTPARPEWGEVAERLAEAIRDGLGRRAVSVEHVGSTAVPGLAAKPIIDLAVGVTPQLHPARVRNSLERMGYQFRGDAGDQGGLVFVLDARPKHRVVHLHVVDRAGAQWRRYLTFRDLLLTDASAREGYERMKRDLAEKFPDDRKAYTAAKERVVRGLLDQHTVKRKKQ